MLSLSMALCAILPAILVILVSNTHIERRLVQEPSAKPSDVIWADRKAELTASRCDTEPVAQKYRLRVTFTAPTNLTRLFR